MEDELPINKRFEALQDLPAEIRMQYLSEIINEIAPAYHKTMQKSLEDAAKHRARPDKVNA